MHLTRPWKTGRSALAFGPAGTAAPGARDAAPALGSLGARSRTLSPVGCPDGSTGAALAPAPLGRQKQRTSRLSLSQTHVSIVSGNTTGTALLAYRQITFSGRIPA